MHGDLSETPLTDVYRRLGVGAASGELTVSGVEADGWVSFRDGTIVAAGSPAPPARLGDRLVGAGELGATELAETVRRQPDAHPPARLGALLVRAGLVSEDLVRLVVQEQVLDALFELSRWRFGSYRFQAGEPVRLAQVPVALAVDDALLDVARRRREWAELSVAIPDLAAVPALQTEPGTTSVGLTGDEFTVLASVDGQRSVHQLADALGYGEFEVARIVYGLVLIGLVAIELPEDEVGAALDDALSYLDRLAVTAGDEPPRVDAEPEATATATPEATATSTPEPPAEVPAEASAPATPRSDVDQVAQVDAVDDVEPEPVSTAGAPDTPTTPAAGEVVEAELPPSDFRAALAELHGLDDDPATSTPPVEPETADTRATPTEADPAGTTPAAAADPPAAGADDFFATRRPDPPPADADEVAEFMRELSRLAFDEDARGTPDGAPRPPQRRPPPARDAPESRPRRRGLFGR